MQRPMLTVGAPATRQSGERAMVRILLRLNQSQVLACGVSQANPADGRLRHPQLIDKLLDDPQTEPVSVTRT